MSLSRREFVLLGVGAFLAGCSSQQQTSGDPAAIPWHDPVARPVPAGPGRVSPVPAPSSSAAMQPPASVNISGIQAIPRAKWARSAPITAKLNPMNGVNRITIHHEGWTPVYFTDYATTAARLERVRQGHLSRLNAGDIGYHYIVDRAGRVWQGRDTRFQGAHVRSNNEHNLGVMCLGNFDQESPTDVQMAAMRDVVAKLMRQYRVPANRVLTHQEINPTACPGRVMQPRVVALRRKAFTA